MANQVQALESLSIPAAMLTSKTGEFEKKAIEKDMKSGHPRIRLLYITPERLAMDKFQNLLKKVYAQGELSRLVIDEAHCISEVSRAFILSVLQFFLMLPSCPQYSGATTLGKSISRLGDFANSSRKCRSWRSLRLLPKCECIAAFTDNLLIG